MIVSVVIPFKNTLDRLERLLQALAQQTYPHNMIDVIIVDDASSEPVSSYMDSSLTDFRELVVLRHEASKGRAASRNAGAFIAKGDLLVFLDSDDLPTPNYILELVRAIQKCNQRCIIRANIRVHPDLITKKNYARYQDSRYIGGRIEAGKFGYDPNDLPPKFVSTNSLALLRKHFVELGGFDEDFRAYGGEDEEFGMRAWTRGFRIVYAQDALIYDFDDRMSLDRLCRRIPEYIQVSLPMLLAKCPTYVAHSLYAQITLGNTLRSRLIRAVSLGLGVIGADAILKCWLRLFDSCTWLRIPSSIYDIVLAVEVAKAACLGSRINRYPSGGIHQ
ncbi:glycosyltransferase [Gelria sp. Kuro-4]|uniref:glycosyltransferase n=1 Tax=Gelria sp. Kuro-4 TaxID=2796927 RepID=UPI001BEDA429|nr:glycosyltransferase [Gelria sp. Kuro-4]BCV25994.1 hypothetical protein kuro4_27670 [Gelria sp. Kuro-4]